MGKRAGLALCIAAISSASPADGAKGADTRRALQEIVEFADKFCDAPPLEGSGSEVQLSAAGKLKLNRLFKYLAELGMAAGTKYQTSRHSGPLQRDIALLLRDRTRCKLELWKDLKDRLLPLEQAPRPPARPDPVLSFKQKYIDAGARAERGKVTYSVLIRAPHESSVNALQDAVQRAVRSRGIHVLSLFRSQFSRDELDLQLFPGNAALAERLELHKHCDVVILGIGGFSGPAQNQDMSGLYMREAVLNLHAIAAKTGEQLGSLKVTAKGRGLDPDSSSVDAMQKLEQRVEEQVTGWSYP